MLYAASLLNSKKRSNRAPTPVDRRGVDTANGTSSVPGPLASSVSRIAYYTIKIKAKKINFVAILCLCNL